MSCIALLALSTLTSYPPIGSVGPHIENGYVMKRLGVSGRGQRPVRAFFPRQARGRGEKMEFDRRRRRADDRSGFRMVDLQPAPARHDRLGQHPVPPARAE